MERSPPFPKAAFWKPILPTVPAWRRTGRWSCEAGTYGYCEETGEPIGLRRLEARPIATLSIEAQERHERMERVHRDD